MSRVTPEQAAAAAKRAVLTLGGAFSDDPKTMRRARQIGLMSRARGTRAWGLRRSNQSRPGKRVSSMLSAGSPSESSALTCGGSSATSALQS